MVSLGTKPTICSGDFAAFEDEQRRDAADAVAAGRHVVLVHVHLHDLELAVVLGGNGVHDRSERAAGAAPRCPEVHQHGRLRLQHVLLEVRVVYIGNKLTCHITDLLGPVFPPCLSSTIIDALGWKTMRSGLTGWFTYKIVRTTPSAMRSGRTSTEASSRALRLSLGGEKAGSGRQKEQH